MTRIFTLATSLCLLSLAGCTFPQPGPGQTKMDVEVNSSEWITASPAEKEAIIQGYEESTPAASEVPY